MSGKIINIGGRLTGRGKPAFVIAEAGVNHNGRIDLAHALVDAAADAGADAVKFQTFNTDDVVTVDAPKAEYQRAATGDGGSQHEMILALELGAGDFAELSRHATERGIFFLSTPFDLASVDLLGSLGVHAFKVPSGEITNPELLLSVASKGKPVLMSTGMAELEEVRSAVEMLIRAGTKELALFQCTSSYPTNPEDVNLRVMHTLECEFQVPVGLSDHTEGIEISLAAVALGASLIEKHLTLDRGLDGPDHAASMEPAQLTKLIRGIRKVEAALGTGIKRPSSNEREVAKVARRSLVAAESLPEGTKLAREHLLFRRPGTGLPPTSLDLVLGKTLTRKLDKGQLITLDLFN